MNKTSKQESSRSALPVPTPTVAKLRSHHRRRKNLLGCDETRDSRSANVRLDCGHTARPFEIEMADAPPRPLELGDLLSLHFVKRNIAFLSSLAFHLVVLSVLSLLLIQAGFGKQMITLELSIPKPVEVEKELTFAPAADDKATDLIPDNTDPINDAANLEDESTKEVSVATKTGAGTSAGEKTSGTTAQFFGTKIRGDSFVYVIDRSRSMNNNQMFSRYDAATSEVIRSVDQLDADQKFYVLLFSNTTTRMFEYSYLTDAVDNNPAELVPATAANKQRLKTWLNQTDAGGGTDPAQSLSIAFDMNPDAVFMLSDGQFGPDVPGSSGEAMKLVRHRNLAKVNIHTIAFDSEESKRNMREIASVSGGEYRFVTLADSMLKLLTSLDGKRRLNVYKNWKNLGQVTWQQRFRLAQAAIKDLESFDVRLRDAANDILHHVSFTLYTKDNNANPIPSEFTLDDSSALAERWNTVWDTANSIQQRSELDDNIESNLSEVLLVVYGDFPNQQRAIQRMSVKLEKREEKSDQIIKLQESLEGLRSEYRDSHVLVSLLSPKPSQQRKALTTITKNYPQIKDQICRTREDKYAFASSDLIPLLNSPEKVIRRLAEESLHRISFGVFVERIPTIVASDEYQPDVADIVKRWHEQWNSANTLHKTKDLSGMFDNGNEAKLLAYLSEIQRHREINELLAFGDSELSMDQQIWLARVVANFQSDVHISTESIALLRKLCNNIHKERTNRKKHWDKQTMPGVWQKRLETAIRRRKSESRRIFSRWKKSRDEEIKSRLRMRILDDYPDTEYAITVRQSQIDR